MAQPPSPAAPPTAMQRPTCKNMRVRNVHDAQVILHAVYLKRLPMLHRRLDDEERQALAPGDIYVWEERSNNPMDAPSLEAMQRFTDGRSWGPSKAREYVTSPCVITFMDSTMRIVVLTATSSCTARKMSLAAARS